MGRIIVRILGPRDKEIQAFLGDGKVCSVVVLGDHMIVGRYGSNKTTLRSELKKYLEAK